MKILKKALLIFFAIIILLVIIAFFLPSKVKVERSAVISTLSCQPYEQLINFHNWESWSPWVKADSTMLKMYEGPESGEGALFKWDSKNKNLGKGSMLITKAVKDSLIEINLTFGNEAPALSGFRFENLKDSVRITWFIEANLGWNPVYRYFGLMMGKMIGPDFEKGLKDLKTICESKPCCSKYKITETTVKPFIYVGIHDTCSVLTIGQKMGRYFGEIMGFISKNGLKPSGAPITFYLNHDKNIFEVEAAVPVDKKIKSKDKNIMVVEFKGGKALTTDYYGPYDKIGEVHMMMMQKIEDQKLKISGVCWEEYITDPSTEKDPSKWLTKIYYPVN